MLRLITPGMITILIALIQLTQTGIYYLNQTKIKGVFWLKRFKQIWYLRVFKGILSVSLYMYFNYTNIFSANIESILRIQLGLFKLYELCSTYKSKVVDL